MADLKVTATARGYYGGRLRFPGEKFVIAKNEDFSKHWMKRAGKSGSSGEKPTPEGYHTVHKGGGSWDVYGPDGEVVEGGDNLKKAEAHALVEELKTSEDESSEEE